MLLTNETPKTICTLTSLLVTQRPNSRVLIVTDSQRLMEPDYLTGEGKMFDMLSKYSEKFTVQRSHNRIRLQNGSVIEFVPLRCERDIEMIQGKEAELIVLDHRCLLTMTMMGKIRSADRTGFSIEDLKRLNGARSEPFHS